MNSEKTGWAKRIESALAFAGSFLGEPEAAKPAQSMLFDACVDGDASGVAEAVAAGADVNKKGPKGLCPLHIAMQSRNEAAVDALLRAGAKANVKDGRGMTPLHHAALHEFEAGATRLIANGANVDAFATSSFTPLHCAAVMGSSGVARALINSGAWLEVQDIDGFTPLHHAANTTRKGNHLEVARLLTERGARLEANEVLDTPLDHAKRNGKPEVRDFLAAAELAKKEKLELGEALPKRARSAQRSNSLSL